MWLFVLAITAIAASEPTKLLLDTVHSLQLPPNVAQSYQVAIPDSYEGEGNLYISAYSLINDPFEEPILQITSEEFSLTCDSEESDLNQVCFIPAEKMTAGQVFSVQVHCKVECRAEMVAYLADTVELDLGDRVELESGQSPLVKSFLIYVPEAEKFDLIEVTFEVTNFEEETEGSQLFLNFGSDPEMPSTDNHAEVIAKSWGATKGYYISKEQGLKGGDWIAGTLYVGMNSQISLSSQPLLGNSRKIQVNQVIFDYKAVGEDKVYQIDLSPLKDRELKPVFIEVLAYSGNPTMEFALTPDFSTAEKISQLTLSWMRYEIDEEAMSDPRKFSYQAYVRISGEWEASFAIIGRANYKQFLGLQESITQYVKVRTERVVQLVYEDFQYLTVNSSSDQRNEPLRRQLSLDTYSGSLPEIAIFLCQASESELKGQCMVPNPSELYSQLVADPHYVPAAAEGYRLLRLESVRTERITTFMQKYSDCISERRFEQTELFACKFVILVFSGKTGADSSVGLTLHRTESSLSLREGNSYSSGVDVDSYRFFTFELAGIKSFESIQIFVNTLDGNLEVMSSLQQPRIRTQQIGTPGIKFAKELITYNSSELAAAARIFISIYGVEYSDFVINIVARRKNSEGAAHLDEADRKFQGGAVSISDIELVSGQTQKYLLEEGQPQMNFKYIATAPQKITVTANELSGRLTLSLQVFMAGSEQVQSLTCKNGVCETEVQKGSSVRAVVMKQNSSSVEFTILLEEGAGCYSFPVGTPLFVSLEPGETDCVQDTVDKQREVEIQNSLSSIQLLREDAVLEVYFPITNSSLSIRSNSFVLTTEAMRQGCPSDERNCLVEFRFSARENPVSFFTIIQKVDGLLYMYDGVPQEVEATISQEKGKFFIYPLRKLDSLEVFFEPISSADLSVEITIMNEDKTSRPEQNFPKIQSGRWHMAIHSNSAIEVMPISSQTLSDSMKVGQFIRPCLVIAVYAKNVSMQAAKFSLEVTQTERVLREGSRQFGFLQKEEVLQYELYPGKKSVLSVHSLQGRQCLSLLDQDEQLAQQGSFGYEVHLNNSASPAYYSLAASGEDCLYMIGLWDEEDRLVELGANYPVEVALQGEEVAFYLYHHNREEPFRVFELISSGDSRVFATPATPEMLKNSDSLELSTFLFVGGESSYLTVDPSFAGFCFECYYLLAVQGAPSVSEQLIVNVEGAPITLMEDSLVDATLLASEEDTFVFYPSGSKFNLSIGVLYGQIGIQVFPKNDPADILTQQKLSTTPNTNLQIELPGQASYETSHTMYAIRVTALRDVSYHLQISRPEAALSISQGVPLQTSLPPSSQTVLGFRSNEPQGHFELLLEQPKVRMIFGLKLKIEYSEGVKAPYTLMRIQTISTGTVNKATFDAKRGLYRIILENELSSPADVVLIIPKAGLTELIPNNRFIGTAQSIFEIYIPEGFYCMAELFECSGSVILRGSSSYAEVAAQDPADNEVELLHVNIGGHYVINAHNITGQYYLRVQQKGEGHLEYLVRYRLIHDGKPNPYQLLDVNSLEIESIDRKDSSALAITVDSIFPAQPNVRIKKIKYFFTLGEDEADIQNVMICSVDSFVKRLQGYLPRDTTEPKITLHLLKQSIAKTMGSKHSYAGVMAAADIEVSGEPESAYENVIFVYQPASISRYIHRPMFTTRSFFEIGVLVLLGMAAIVLVYTLWHEGLLKLRGYQADAAAELVEEDSHNQVGNGSSDNNFQISRQEPQTGKERE